MILGAVWGVVAAGLLVAAVRMVVVTVREIPGRREMESVEDD